jgi:hypothetical protein
VLVIGIRVRVKVVRLLRGGTEQTLRVIVADVLESIAMVVSWVVGHPHPRWWTYETEGPSDREF